MRLIVRRVKPTPGSQLALFAIYSHHGFITDRDGDTLELEADHRRHAEIENAIRDLKHGVGLNHLPSGRFAANGAWLAVQVLAHNLARWTARIGLDEGVVTTKTLRRPLLLPGRTAHPLGPPPHRASSTGLALGNPFHSRPGSIASPAIACLTAPTAPDPSTRLPNRPTESHRPGPRLSSPACCPADPAPAPLPRTAIGAPNDNQRPPQAPFIGIERGPSRPTPLTPCSNPKAAPHRWIRAYRPGLAVLECVCHRQHIGGGLRCYTFANHCEEGTVSSNSRSNENKGSKNAGSYAPEWEKKSLDIVPPNDQNLPKNPVAEAIMGVDSPSRSNT